MKKKPKWLVGIGSALLASSIFLYPKQKMKQKGQILQEIEPKEPELEKSKEKVAIYTERDQALQLRLEAIRMAKEAIKVAQYAIESDESGDVFAQALLEAAQRGVQVKLLCNSLTYNWKYSQKYKESALLNEPNFQISVYGGLRRLRPWEINNVLHDKLLLVDHRLAISSGRNVGNRFLWPKVESKTKDMDVIIYTDDVDAPLIQKMEEYFNQLWNAPFVTRKKLYSKKKGTQAQERFLSKAKQSTKEYANQIQGQPLSLSFYPVEGVGFWHNSAHENIKSPWIAQQFLSLLATGKVTWIQTPYFVWHKTMRKGLENLRQYPTKVMTNSVATSPNFFAYSCYLRQKTWDEQYGEMVEYHGQNSLHHKGFLYGEKGVGIGSYNLDCRSTFLDTENLVLLQSKELHDQWQAQILAYQAENLPSKNVQWKQKVMEAMGRIVYPFYDLT